MYCSNCRADVAAANGGYCSQCGTPLNTRLCPNGHIMDVSWTECRYCAAGARVGGPAIPGAKGRTVIETPSATATPGGFVKGATLLEGSASPVKGRTLHEGGAAAKGRTMVDGPAGGRPKARTVFDSGSGPAPGASPPKAQPKLVGWLVTFSHVPSGEDYRLREGRNILGSDVAECDIAVAGDTSISGKHAVIVFRNGQFQIRDNDSTNGTYVNGKDIFGEGAVAVSNLDTIRLGTTEFVLYTLQQA
jgi:hypothetical protein